MCGEGPGVVTQQAVIYSSGGANPWTVIVSRHSDASVVISSGDKDADWNISIEEKHSAALEKALSREISRAEVSGAGADVVELFMSAFGGQTENPFTEIERFLRVSGVPFEKQAWIGE